MKWLALSFLVIASASFPKDIGNKEAVKPLTLQEQRWRDATVRTSKQSTVRWTTKQIERNKSRYQAIERKTGVPWEVVGGLHNMEASLSFSKHIHNGDPLTARTKLVPRGRPKKGNPPFSWEESCIDSMYYDGLDKVNWKSKDSSLYAIEKYNGTGYLRYHPTVPSPYLWGGSTIYGPPNGKYVADGKWSSTAVSKQIGVCVLLKDMGFDW